MKRMPNIKLTNDELDIMLFDSKFDYGGEAIVLRGPNQNTLYKIFVYPSTEIPEIISPNKEKKINELYQKQLESSVRPVSTISLKGQLIGYEMTYDEGDQPLLNLDLTPEEKMYVLEKTADILSYFETQDVTYGDVKDDNILYNPKTKEVKFCDMDNTRIGSLPIDVMGHGLYDYHKAVGVIDEKTDAYMHNLLLLEQLRYNNLSHKAILTRLRQKPMMPEFPEEVETLLNGLTEPENFDGRYAVKMLRGRL